MFSRSQEYLEVEKSDNESEQQGSNGHLPRKNSFRRQYFISLIFNVFLSIAFISSLFFGFSRRIERSDKALIHATSSASPVLSKVPLTLTLQTINGSFMSETEIPDIFRALPSPEVDEAWHKIGHPTWISINSNQAIQLGKDPSTLVQIPADWGLGPDRFVAMLDLNHQLHCIDQLRRAAFREEYPFDLNSPRAFLQKEHWMHCVHILKQNAMCYGSTEVITYNWVETQRFPVPDFNVNKVCKNSEVLLDFQERERIVDAGKLRDEMVPPKDAKVLPMPPRLKALFDAHENL